MQRDRQKWREGRATRALRTIGEIEASIAALDDEDLLDLHDIFAGSPGGALERRAADEMRRRKLSA